MTHDPRPAMLLRSLPVLAALLLAPPAQAAPFGYGDDIHRLADVKAVGAKSEPLFIGYRTSHYQLLLGLYVKDEGYVLGVRADPERYYDMPEGEELTLYQARGLLPNPLPAYAIGTLGYALGYAFWPFLLILIGGGAFGVRLLLPKKASPAEPASADTDDPAKAEMSPAFALLLALFKKRQAKPEATA